MMLLSVHGCIVSAGMLHNHMVLVLGMSCPRNNIQNSCYGCQLQKLIFRITAIWPGVAVLHDMDVFDIKYEIKKRIIQTDIS